MEVEPWEEAPAVRILWETWGGVRGGGRGDHGSAEERELICILEVELIGLADGLGMSGKNREMTPNHRF